MNLTTNKRTHYLLWALSLLIASVLWYLFLKSDGLRGGMDSYNHYLIAKYSFKHPELLLDYWGKPVYNLIAAPFSQFGIGGVVVLNIICLISSAWLAYYTAIRLGLKQAWLAFVLCLFSPIFLDQTISGLTEPLNALLLMGCIYLFATERWHAGLLLAGFLPFARSEGFVILAVLIFYVVLVRRDLRSLLLVLVGSLLFNLIGWYIEGKPFWVITENPYIKFQLSGDNVCGSGPIWHYLRWSHVTFGLLTSILIVTGAFRILLRAIRDRAIHLDLLVLAIFSAYFLAHTLIWALGMMGSCGYIRVMVVIAPLGVLIAVRGLEFIPKFRWRSAVIALFLAFVLYEPYKYYNYLYPVQITEEQQLYVEMYDWIKDTEYNDRSWMYMYPYLSMISNRDPSDSKEHIELWNTSLPYIEKGTVVIWDAHFGPNESRIPLESLLNSENYRLLRTFKPAKAILTLNNYEFEIYVFEKLVEKES